MKTQAEVLRELIQCLAAVKARYLIGGSVASSAVGVPRSTLDADLLVEIQSTGILELAVNLGGDWYIDPEFASRAVEQGRAFNLIHIPSGYKFDIFPAHNAFHRSELKRATMRQLGLPGGTVGCLVATAEDVLLAKLLWYRDGGKVSERQWADITGILKINRTLELPYLATWAAELDVSNLLESAIRAATESN